MWSELAADVNWHDDGSEQSDVTALTGPFETALVEVLADYFEGHVLTPPAISGKTVDQARLAASTAALAIVNFEKSGCPEPSDSSTSSTCIHNNRGTVYDQLDKPQPNIRWTNWDNFYNTLLLTATTEWNRKCSFVARVERLRDLYTAISEAWPAGADRSALDDMFNGTDSSPGLDNDIKLNINRGISACLTAQQAGLMVGQYINLQGYWKELIDTADWNSSWSDEAKVDTASAGVEKHIEDVVTEYFERNIKRIRDSVEVGAEPDARLAAQSALAITDPGPDPDSNPNPVEKNTVRVGIYDELGKPWPKPRYDAWAGFYKGLSDAVKDDTPKTAFPEKMGRLLGLYTKLYNVTPSKNRSGLDTMHKAVVDDISRYMHANHTKFMGPVALKGRRGGCLDCPHPVSSIAARLDRFVQGASLQHLQTVFGTNIGYNHRAVFSKWYAFYNAFKEAAG